MTTLPRSVDFRRRLVTAAGWAGIVWGLFQIVATRRDSLGYWVSVVAINGLPTLLLGWATLRRFTIAAALLGLYGVFRLYVATRVITQRLDGATAQPTDWWVAPLAIPFALLWIVGAVAAVIGWRTSRHVKQS